MDKKELTNEVISKMTDGKSFDNMEDLIAFVISDPNAKGFLRKFLYEEEKIKLESLEDRIDYLRNNYFIDGNDNVNLTSNERPPKGSFEEYEEYYRTIVVKNVNNADEDTMSSQTITLIESSVIEKEALMVSWYSEEKLDESKVFIAEKEGDRLFAVGHLLSVTPDRKNKYWAIFDRRDWIKHADIAKEKQVRLILFTEENKTYYRIVDLEYHEMKEERERPLCIDFGTSNTTVGTYGIKSKESGNLEDDIVKFVDVTSDHHRIDALMMPTVVYVQDCSDENNIKYLFGYEALKQIEQVEHYQVESSIFFEIKRWMIVPTKKEDIRDKDNNHAVVERRHIIKAYIDYVIDLSEQYYGRRFKKLHFSAPVKLKSLFINTFKDLYAGSREVLSEDESIDEAFAIVYNHIMNLIDKNKNINDDKKRNSLRDQKVFIMDCGGGTTDLADCIFSYERKEGYTDILEYTTSFKNGNSNFGGNNLTYRIMQLLKIKIAEKYVNDGSICGDAKFLINKSEDEIFEIIDKSKDLKMYDSDNTENEVYSKFVEMYNKCESIIPTKYADEKDQSDKKKKTRNFYYMWRLAERIKIEFFSTDQVRIEFGNSDVPVQLQVDTKNDYFWIDKDGRLVNMMDPLKGIVVTNKDVERVICGDIYGLLFGLIGDGNLDDKTNVSDFHHYKLSGQSCKISMFKELLKEYIPGKKLRAKKGNSNNSEKLKLECLKGCIQFIRDTNGHELAIKSHIGLPKMIYDIYIENQHAEDELIFDSRSYGDDNTIFKVFSVKSSEMTFIVRNDAGNIEKKIDMSLVGKTGIPYGGSEELILEIAKEAGISKERTKIIFDNMFKHISGNISSEGIKVLFAIPSADNYAVIIILIQAVEEEKQIKYKLINRKLCSFENPNKTFFDGKR